jgi:Fur family transcriptional regulator, peroxide stress response regulator
MSVPPEAALKRAEVMSAVLRRSGLRLTHQRLEILKELAAADVHPDVEAIYHAVRERVPTISIDTVYRTTAALVHLGCVRRVSATVGPARYDPNVGPHHHFVCQSCGLIADIEDADLDVLSPPSAVGELGEVSRAEVYFKGVCRSCAARSG